MGSYLLVRHASATLGGPNPGLSHRGRAEAEALARRLQGLRFDAAWSSDLARAEETAGAILSRHRFPPLRWCEALREVEPPAEPPPPAADPLQYAAWERDVLSGLAGRLAKWLGQVAAASPSGGQSPRILVVSHAGPLRVLICLLLGLPVAAHWCFHLDRAGITVVERCGDMGTLTLLNDRCHLAEVDAGSGKDEELRDFGG